MQMAERLLFSHRNSRSLLDLCGLAGSPRLERALHFVRSVGASGA